ncbi:MAG TPA: hypothetical protein VN635_13270 [Conexibacter sp.]|nr:hypothetical protein [Conexibacter sp.]
MIDRRAADLTGCMAATVDLAGRVSIPGGRHLGASFPAVPDVPVSRVVLRFNTGARGVAGLGRELCSAKAGRERASATLAAHNGSVVTARLPLARHGCG